MKYIVITLVIAVLLWLLTSFNTKKMKKNNISKFAIDELNFWNGGNETDPKFKDRLVKYWASAGHDWITDKNIEKYDNEWAWSAAFICYVAQKVDKDFPKSATHAGYTVIARDRKAQGFKTIIAYEPKDKKVEVGDIIVLRRSGGYNGTLKDLYSTAKTHGDIVTGVDGQKVTAIGGNVGNTVKKSFFDIDSNGYLIGSKFIAIIKL